MVTDEGRELGLIREIIETGANNVFVVEGETGKEFLIPDIEDVVRDIRMEAGEIIVRLLDGLIPDLN